MRSKATTARGVPCGGASTSLEEPVPAHSTGKAASVHPRWGRNGTTVLWPIGFRPSPVPSRGRGWFVQTAC